MAALNGMMRNNNTLKMLLLNDNGFFGEDAFYLEKCQWPLDACVHGCTGAVLSPLLKCNSEFLCTRETSTTLCEVQAHLWWKYCSASGPRQTPHFLLYRYKWENQANGEF